MVIIQKNAHSCNRQRSLKLDLKGNNILGHVLLKFRIY